MVDYHLVDVNDGDYPQSQGQQWAEPDIDHAAFLLDAVINDPARGRAMARQARTAAILNCSNRAVGLRMAARLSDHPVANKRKPSARAA